MIRYISPCPQVVLLMAVAAIAAPAAAQITTDRPDFVESSSTVGTGVIQIETSLAMERAGDAETWSTPTLLRIGLSAAWEFRVESPGYLRAGEPLDQSGFGDAALGVKWHLGGGGGWRPARALLLHAEFPLGSDDFRQAGVRPSIRGVAEWELTQRLSFGSMAGVISDREGQDRFTSGILAGVLGWGWTDTFRTFSEIALTQVAKDQHGGTVAAANLGGTILLGEHAQIDGGISLPLSDSDSGLALTVGFSRRFGR
jgi:hypothetical protein